MQGKNGTLLHPATINGYLRHICLAQVDAPLFVNLYFSSINIKKKFAINPGLKSYAHRLHFLEFSTFCQKFYGKFLLPAT
jgi:hypothetical protein